MLCNKSLYVPSIRSFTNILFWFSCHFNCLSVRDETSEIPIHLSFFFFASFGLLFSNFHIILFSLRLIDIKLDWKSFFLNWIDFIVITWSPSAIWAIVLPVAGFIVGNVLPETASTNWLLMKIYRIRTQEISFKYKFLYLIFCRRRKHNKIYSVGEWGKNRSKIRVTTHGDWLTETQFDMLSEIFFRSYTTEAKIKRTWLFCSRRVKSVGQKSSKMCYTLFNCHFYIIYYLTRKMIFFVSNFLHYMKKLKLNNGDNLHVAVFE